MATEFRIELPNRPGALADLGEALGQEEINIEALLAITQGELGFAHVVTADAVPTRSTLAKNGFPFSEREVLIVRVLNEPGALGDVARVMADGDINIEAAYVTISGQLVLVVDDMHGAVQVASGMAVAI